MEPIILRPHQDEAIELLSDSIANGSKSPVLQGSTGFGKTLVSVSITKRALAKGKRVCFVVPALGLIDQTVESFMRHGITDIGVIQADHPMTDYSKRVQVASIQTLSRRGYPTASPSISFC